MPSGTSVGGPTSEAGNLVVGNREVGIEVVGGSAANNMIASNTARGNGIYGIAVENLRSNTVVQSGPAANVVDGNPDGYYYLPASGPTVVSTTPDAVGGMFSAITITFSSPLNASAATNLKNYQLVILNARSQVTGHVTITSAVYDDASMTVTLALGVGIPEANSYRLTLVGQGKHAIADPAGNKLDGANRLKSGSNYAFNFGAASAKITAIAHRHGPKVRHAKK